MSTIKGVLFGLTMVFLFVTPKDSIASKYRQQIIKNQNLDDILKNKLGYIVAHKAEKPHPHPHNIMMGKKIKKEMKKDKLGMKTGDKGAKSPRLETKQREQRSKNIRKHK